MTKRRRKRPGTPAVPEAPVLPEAPVVATLESPEREWRGWEGAFQWFAGGELLAVRWGNENVRVFQAGSWRLVEQLPFKCMISPPPMISALVHGRCLWTTIPDPETGTTWNKKRTVAWDVAARKPAWESDWSAFTPADRAIDVDGTVILGREFGRIDATTGRIVRADRRFIRGGVVYSSTADGEYPPALKARMAEAEQRGEEIFREYILAIAPGGKHVVTDISKEDNDTLFLRDIDTLALVDTLRVAPATPVNPRLLDILRNKMEPGELAEYVRAGEHSGFNIIYQVPAGGGRYLIIDNYDDYVYVVDIAAVPIRVAHVFDKLIWAWSGDGRSVCYRVPPEGKTPLPPRWLPQPASSIDGDYVVSHEMDKMVEMPRAAPHDTPAVSPLPPPSCRFTPLVGEMQMGTRETEHVRETVHPHSFSPDGRWLATTYGDKVCIRDVKRGSPSSITNDSR